MVADIVWYVIKQSLAKKNTQDSCSFNIMWKVFVFVPASIYIAFSRDASSFGRSNQPNMPPSTPSEGTFFPDAPIQFDIIAPCEDAKLSRPDGSDGVPRLVIIISLITVL